MPHGTWISWSAFRNRQILRGELIGGTLDLEQIGFPSHPNMQYFCDQFLRGTVTKILWDKRKGFRNQPRRIVISKVSTYIDDIGALGNLGFREGWRRCNESIWLECSPVVYPIHGADGRFYFSLDMMSSVALTPKGVEVPEKHLLYEKKTRISSEPEEVKARLWRRIERCLHAT